MWWPSAGHKGQKIDSQLYIYTAIFPKAVVTGCKPNTRSHQKHVPSFTRQESNRPVVVALLMIPISPELVPMQMLVSIRSWQRCVPDIQVQQIIVEWNWKRQQCCPELHEEITNTYTWAPSLIIHYHIPI